MAAKSSDSKSLHLTELRVSNFMGLKAVVVQFDGAAGVIEVSGPNGAGKTSFMRAIESLVAGSKMHPAVAIRRGEDEAELIGRLKGTAGELVVERRWRKTEKGEVSTVVVRGADGARYDKPQSILDALFNNTLDPEAFKQMPKEKQLELLKKLSGLDFGALEGKRLDLYESRTNVNRKGGDLAARFKAMTVPATPLPDAPIDVDALLAEQNVAYGARAENEKVRRLMTGLEGAHDQRRRNLEIAQKNVARLEKELEEARSLALDEAGRLADAKQRIAEHQKAIDALVDPDVQSIVAKISAAQSTNIAIAREVDRKKLEAELATLRAESQTLTDAIELLDKEKAAKISAAKFPVEGLGLGVDGPTFNGLPFEQANHAQQLRVSTAICLAGNPTMRVLGIRNGSALDTKGMQIIAEEAAKHDAQIFVERPADKGEVGIVIEDGAVVPVRAVKGGAV